MDGCQGEPWSEELDNKELHGAAGGNLEPREPAVSCTWSTWSTRLSPFTSVVLLLILKGWGFDRLFEVPYCYSST